MEKIRLLTWNCNGALRKKFNVLDKFDADLVIIQECEDPSQSKDASYKKWAENFLWTGDNRNKGLGIFARKGIQLIENDWEDNGTKFFISCRINNEFNVIAAWCHGADSPTFGYIGQLWKYLQVNKLKMTDSIVAGDFNSNKIWDKWDRWWNHSDVVRELKEIGIESLYHNYYKEEQGSECRPTFYLQKDLKKPYHIDYIFASSSIYEKIESFRVGNIDEWVELSDHVPVFAELFPKCIC